MEPPKSAEANEKVDKKKLAKKLSKKANKRSTFFSWSKTAKKNKTLKNQFNSGDIGSEKDSKNSKVRRGSWFAFRSKNKNVTEDLEKEMEKENLETGDKNDLKEDVTKVEEKGNETDIESEILSDSDYETSDEEEDPDFVDEHALEKEAENYEILNDTAFEDLETETVFNDPELEIFDVLEEEEQPEVCDVLDKSAPVKKITKYLEMKFIERNLVPPIPEGGWKWRRAKVVDTNMKRSQPEPGSKLQQEIIPWKFEFLDEEGGEAIVDVNNFPQMLAVERSKSDAKTLHPYEKNQKVDVLDTFVHVKTGKKMQKWRKAEILSVDKYWIRIHYIGWKHSWDVWLHVISDGHLIKEHTRMTEAFSRRHKRLMSNFQKVLNRKRNLKCVRMDADGNCLFRCVAHQVYGNPAKHLKVRDECCNYLAKNKSRFTMFSNNINARIAKMRKPGEWGDDLEIRVMEEIYDRPFEMYIVNKQSKGIVYRAAKIHFNGDLPKRVKYVTPIRVSYHGNCHYNSIVPLELKMKNNDSFQAPPKRQSSDIKNHRERMLRKADRSEQRRKREAKIKAREEKNKKAKENADEEVENPEGKAEEDQSSETSSDIVTIADDVRKKRDSDEEKDSNNVTSGEEASTSPPPETSSKEKEVCSDSGNKDQTLSKESEV